MKIDILLISILTTMEMAQNTVTAVLCSTEYISLFRNILDLVIFWRAYNFGLKGFDCWNAPRSYDTQFGKQFEKSMLSKIIVEVFQPTAYLMATRSWLHEICVKKTS